jgi:hypothetical protein
VAIYHLYRLYHLYYWASCLVYRRSGKALKTTVETDNYTRQGIFFHKPLSRGTDPFSDGFGNRYDVGRGRVGTLCHRRRRQ